MSGRSWHGVQRIVAAVFVGMTALAAPPAVGQAAAAPSTVERQSQLPPSGLTPEQQEAFLESVSEQIFQGSGSDAPSRELIEALVQEVRKCLVVELATGKTISQAAEACADVVQEAISPGSGSQPLSPEDQQWLAQADAGLRARGRNQGWSESDANNASMLTTGCIARFLKAGAPREVGLQKCSFAFTIWEDARTAAGAVAGR